jgi:uncharacterized surface protein with fasciclin (FAS1) repeats
MKQIRTSLIAAGIAVVLGSAAHAQQSQGPGSASQERSQRQTEGVQQRQEQQPVQRSQDAESRQSAESRQGSQSGQGSRQTAAQRGQSGDSGSLDRIAEEHSELSTFVRALEVTGLADSITGNTQYTAFAPTNEAFEELGRSTEQLLAPENRERLTAMLRAHIVADDVDRETAGQLSEALALNGETISIEERGGSLRVGDASVRDADVQHGNLRIYMIDEVLDRGESQVATSEEGQRPRG